MDIQNPKQQIDVGLQWPACRFSLGRYGGWRTRAKLSPINMGLSAVCFGVYGNGLEQIWRKSPAGLNNAIIHSRTKKPRWMSSQPEEECVDQLIVVPDRLTLRTAHILFIASSLNEITFGSAENVAGWVNPNDQGLPTFQCNISVVSPEGTIMIFGALSRCGANWCFREGMKSLAPWLEKISRYHCTR